MDYRNPKLLLDANQLPTGKVKWRSPSNIALVKYWGKHGRQLPRNASLSLTLSAAHTETELHYRPKKEHNDRVPVNLFLDGTPQPAFAERVQGFFEGITTIYPFLRQLDLSVYTSNSFPHSAGIASSASAMSALALCLCSLERKFFLALSDDQAFFRKASYLARLGSGSASRSLYPVAALWGYHTEVKGSSDEVAIPFADQLHPVFQSFRDTIVLVSKATKQVSSSAGHQLMEQNVFADVRYQQANQHLSRLLLASREGDLEIFGSIIESEALTLHALMMTSNPSYILMEPATLEMIQRVRAFRTEQQLPLYFTLDAGPNLHLLYPSEHMEAIGAFIQESLAPLGTGQIIEDSVGQGPVEID